MIIDSENLIESIEVANFFDGPYFHLNKRLLRMLGLWPYGAQKKVMRFIWVTSILIFTVPHVTAVIVDTPDIDKLMEDAFNLLFVAQLLLKYLTLCYAEDKMKSVYTDIANNWLLIVDEEEKQILLEYSKRGRSLSVFYVGLLVATYIFNVGVPLIPEILNVLYPLEEPRPHFFLLKGEYLVVKDDHFYKIYMCDIFSIFLVVMIFMGIDSMYTVTVEQGTALYAIITHRLSKLSGQGDFSDGTDNSYEWLIHTIKLHQTVLSFINNIKESYSACFFCLSIINIVHLPLTCVVAMVHSDDLVIVGRCAFILICLLIHIFALFWPGQKLIDHSKRIIDDAYFSGWYDAPMKTKKLYRFFMLRCSKPFVMTAGGVMEMSFEVYLKIVKTAASYVTVLASYR